jgi:hypothetical protein
MTVETKTTIQPSDISAIEFECLKCHTVTHWPLEVAKNPLTRCHCSEENWMPYGGDTYVALANFMALLNRFSKAKAEPYRVRLALNSALPLGHVSGDGD